MSLLKQRGIPILLITAVISSSWLTTSAMAGQAYVNDQLISHTITKDSRIYVPLAEVSDLLGADVEYDPESNTAYVTQNGSTASSKGGTVKHTELYPTNVEVFDTPTGKELIKTYELVAGQNPANIPREDFEENGYTYKLADITKESLVTRDEKETTETLTIQTKSKEINEVIKEIPQEKEFTTSDGYTGVLQLDVNSIETSAAGYKSYSYTVSDTREYPNLTTTDTSQIPKSITKNGQTLSLVSVDWRSANVESVDYLNVPNVYTAVATYSAAASGRSVTGYQTTAKYTGTVEKIDTKGTVYTARYVGTVVSVKQAKELVNEAKAYEKIAAKATKAGLTVEEYLAGRDITAVSSGGIFGVIGALIGVLIAAALLLAVFRKNVTVFAPDDEGEYEKIGKVKLSKRKPIINLGSFNDVITNPNFLLVMDKFTAWRMRGVNITLHRGDTTMQHTVNSEKGKKYQFNVKF